MAEHPPRLDWAGFYLDGRTAVRRPVTVRLGRTALEASVEGGETFRWAYDDVRQTQGFHAGEPVRLEYGDGITQALVLPDADFLRSLKEVAGPGAGRFKRAGRLRPRVVVAAALGTIALAFVMYLWGIPIVARAIGAHVPVSWEERLGSAVVDRLAPPERRCRGAAGQRALDTLVARLTGAEPSPYRFRVLVIDDGVLNAFAAPGGHLVVFRGLVDRARNPEELAGVLAHETQHVLRRHATRAIVERASTGLLVATIAGDVSGLIAFAVENATTLAYSRQHEDEADVEGMRLLRAARIDPRGLTTFFETMLAEEARAPRAMKYLSTHPSTEDRIARLRSLTATSGGAAYTPALTDEQWQALRRICARGA